MIKSKENLRWYAKIELGEHGDFEVAYFNKDFTFEQFCKWRWFFEYRQALIKIKNPRKKCLLTWGSYDYMPAKQQAIKLLKDRIAGKQRTITKYKILIIQAENNWSELFPIQENEYYKKAILKLQRLQNELLELELSFNEIEK